MIQIFFNFPIFLTWLRIILIPLIIGSYYLPASCLGPFTPDVLACFVFVLAALTDWLDGFFARRLGQTSAFGAFLDPVADKLMVSAALLMLLQLGRITALIALIIIGREIAISALREWMAELGMRQSIAVSSIGKIKTAAQMIAIPMLFINRELWNIDFRIWGVWLIYLAMLLTLISMLYYLKLAWVQIRSYNPPGTHS